MQTKRQVIGGLILLAAFSWLTFAVSGQLPMLQYFDAATAVMAKQAVTPFNTSVFKAIAFLGSPTIAIMGTIMLSIFLAYHHRLALGAWIAIVQLFGSAIAELCKELVSRPRPTGQLVPDTGFSYPSGHTFCTTILILALITITVPLIEDQEVKVITGLTGGLWVLLVAISRVYLRDHFASDVVAAALLGGGLWLLASAAQPYCLRLLNQILPEGSQSE